MGSASAPFSKFKCFQMLFVNMYLLPSQPPAAAWSGTSQSVGSSLLVFPATTATTWPATGCWRPLRAKDFTFTSRRWHWLRMTTGKKDIQPLCDGHCNRKPCFYICSAFWCKILCWLFGGNDGAALFANVQPKVSYFNVCNQPISIFSQEFNISKYFWNLKKKMLQGKKYLWHSYIMFPFYHSFAFQSLKCDSDHLKGLFLHEWV